MMGPGFAAGLGNSLVSIGIALFVAGLSAGVVITLLACMAVVR